MELSDLTSKGKNISITKILSITVWLIAALFFMYEFFLRTFVGALSHQIIPQLHLNLETFALLGSAYYFIYAIMQVPVGIIIDKIGIKKTMIFATALCGVSTLFFASSTNFGMALFSRMLMGFASSFAFICLLVIARNSFSKKDFGFYAGLSQLIGTLGPILAGGPLVMMVKSNGGHWRSIMGIIGLLGFLLTGLSVCFVKDKTISKQKNFIRVDVKKVKILKSVKNLFTNKQAWCVAFYSAFNYAPIATLGAIWGTDFIESKGISQITAASAVSAIWIGYAVGCPLMGIISDKLKRRVPMLIFQGILGTLIGFSLFLPIDNIKVLTFIFFMLGIAGGGQNIGFATISECVEENISSTALGLNNSIMLLTDTFLPFIFGALVAVVSHGKAVDLIADDFKLALLLVPMLYIASTLIAVFFIKETYCRPQKDVVVIKSNTTNNHLD